MGDNNGGAVAGSFTMQAQLPDGQSITFSGYVLQGEGLADVNQKVDLGAKVIERRRLSAEIPVLEKAVAAKRDTLRQMDQVIADLEKVPETRNLKSREAQTMDQHKRNRRTILEDIDKGEEAVVTAKHLLSLMG